jgi:hypothetical protein
MSGRYRSLSVYFCWACDAEADPSVPAERHFDQRSWPIRFCSFTCRAVYLELSAL